MNNRPFCSTCLGNGVVRYDIKDLDDPRFGKLFPCPRCETTALYTRDDYGLERPDYRLTWDGLFVQNEGTSEAIYALKERIELGWGWSYLYGPYGTGKTTLIKTALAEGLKRKMRPLFVTAARLLDELKETYSGGSGSLTGEVMRKYTNAELLGIDEIDKINPTGWASERLFEILNKRYEFSTRIHRTITMLSSNTKPENLWSQALASRINDARFDQLELSGADIRENILDVRRLGGLKNET